jgi:branched-subunit amino acid transport protein
MPFFLPQRWRQQPQFFTRIDRKGIGADCTFFYYKTGSAWYDAVSRMPAASDGSTQGRGLYRNLATTGGAFSNTLASFTNIPSAEMLGEMSIAAGVAPTSLNNYSQIISAGKITSNFNTPFDFRMGVSANDAFLYLFRANASAYKYFKPSGTADRIAAGSRGFVGVSAGNVIEEAPTFYSYDEGDPRFLILAADAGTGTGTGAATTLREPMYIGKRFDAVTYLNGSLFFVAGFNKKLSESAFRALNECPWQILAPLTTTKYFIYPTTAAGSIKTRDGLAWASVKTINGLAAASIKTINGVTAN